MVISGLNPDEKQVFGKLQKEGPMTKKSLLSCFDYTPSTLNRIIASLAEKKAIVEFGQEESSGGRKPSLFDANTSEKYLIGFDITRSYSSVVLCDLKMTVKASEIIDLPDPTSDYSPQWVIAKMTIAVQDILTRCSISVENILGAGLGMVGPVNRLTGCTGKIYDFPVDTWSNVPLRDLLEATLNVPVYVDNGAYAGVLAEYLYGEGKNYESVAYFNCGVGIRSGFISSGVLIRAADFVEDSFSHTTINVMGERCYCGKRGCVRCYAATPVISENIRRRINAGERSLIDVSPDRINYLYYTIAAENGDVISKEELSNAGYYLGIGLANYITLLNPRYIVINGPLIMESSIFYNSVIQTASSNIYKSEKSKIVFKKGGSFGFDNIAIGAAAMFFERYMGNSIMS